MRSLAVLGLLVVVAACATTTPEPKTEEPAPQPVEEKPAPEPVTPLASELPPKIFGEVAKRFEFLCPAPHFTLEEPREFESFGTRFVIEGTTLRLLGERTGPLRIGVVGAPKDATAPTANNLKAANALFEKAGVDLVLVPGDIAEDEDLRRVMELLGESFPHPVLLHSGNIEWTGAFSNAFAEASAKHPNLFNLNWSPHVDLGGAHLLALPGYHNKKFSRSGACRYSHDDVAALQEMAKRLRASGAPVVFSSHGPPENIGEGGLDFAHEGAGNVGDPDITALLEAADVRFGIFSHILEAGGRAVGAPNGKKSLGQLKKGQKTLSVGPVEQLYINAGSASSFPWTMLDGSSSTGMAAVFVVDGNKASVSFHRL